MMMRRRKFLTAIAAWLAVPRGAGAQSDTKVWRVGYLSVSTRSNDIRLESSVVFAEAMRELGYVEGRNLVIERRFAEFKTDRLPGLAAELVDLKLDAIVAAGTQPTRALQRKTTTIPIVMGSVGDPVASGFVRSLAKPGGNITGLSNLAVDYSAKQLELLRSLLPKLRRVAALVNPTNGSHPGILKSLQAASQRVHVDIAPVEARSLEEMAAAFEAMVHEHAGAVVVFRDPLFNSKVDQIAGFASRHRLASMGGLLEFTQAGGFASYGTNLSANFRRAAIYVDKILRGARPADLPVEQPTTIEFAINLKTAKRLGIAVPPRILARADKVIE